VQFPITVGLHCSRFLLALLCLVHALAIISILATPWSIVWRLGLVVVCMAALVLALHSARVPVSALQLSRDGRLLASNGDLPEFESCSLLPGAYIHPLLTVFRITIGDGSVRTILVLPDSMAAEDARRLRLFLRFQAKPDDGDDV